MDSLHSLNVAIFIWINQDGGHHYAWLDWSMMFLSDSVNGIIPIVLITFFVFWRDGKQAWRIVALMLLLLLLTDWSGAQIKHWFMTERPCQTIEGVRLLVNDCGHNSFPSNHAINMAAMATYAGWHYRVLIAPMAILAILVGISRIYVGVHYPGDVLFGWVWGMFFATAFYWICWRILPIRYYSWREASGFPVGQKNKNHEEKDQ